SKQEPSPLVTEFTTARGHTVRTRLIRPDDADHLIDLFHHLSPETRRRRFNVGLQNVEAQRVRQTAQELADVDNVTNGGAILGFASTAEGERLIGVARLARFAYGDTPNTAEVAVVVRDDFQGQGIGTELLRLLLILARQMRFSELTATVQADNIVIFHMLAKMNVPVRRRTRQGETELSIDLA
ncbi:MAG: GNAT family N-acetyltransferase, partial [Caldilineaceae bacterium]